MKDVPYIILAFLLKDLKFTQRTLVHLKPEYFMEEERLIFEAVSKFYYEFGGLPVKDEVIVELSEISSISDVQLKDASETVSDITDYSIEDHSFDWIFDKAEVWCKDRALEMALEESIYIQDEDTPHHLSKSAIPGIISDALAVTFDTSVGNDYWEDAEARYEYYVSKTHKTPFDIEMFNKATLGGAEKGTLNMGLAGTNVGKTLVLCHFAAMYAALGQNVLYISNEMSEFEIMKRIDGNVLNFNINKFEDISKLEYMKMMAEKRQAVLGNVKVKQYPTSEASTLNYRALLDELKLKQAWVPDVVCVDYIGITASAKIKGGLGQVNTNTYYKAVADELRAMFIDYDVIGWSMNQFNRGGFKSNDPDLDDSADSFGQAMTADFIFSIMTDEQMMELGQYGIKILKSRYNKKGKELSRFRVGVDYDKQMLFNLDFDDSYKDKLETLGGDKSTPRTQNQGFV